MKICIALAAALVIAVTGPAHAQYVGLSPDEEATIATADALAKDGRCDKAWEIMWPLFKNGSAAASDWIATAIFLGGLVPPGGTPDSISQVRHTFVFATYGAPAESIYDFDLTDTIHDLVPVHNLKFKECMEAADRDAQICVDEAIQYGIVPPRDVYIAELEAMAEWRESPAVCTRDAAILPPDMFP